jgi:hypothetical protein
MSAYCRRTASWTALKFVGRDRAPLPAHRRALLFRALDLPPATNVSIDGTLRSELIEGRDLHEHWVENLPIFNVMPRPAEPPRRSGRAFAARNPDTGPYWWLGFSHQSGR